MPIQLLSALIAISRIRRSLREAFAIRPSVDNLLVKSIIDLHLQLLNP